MGIYGLGKCFCTEKCLGNWKSSKTVTRCGPTTSESNADFLVTESLVKILGVHGTSRGFSEIKNISQHQEQLNCDTLS